jgi:hypothetical protein
MKSWRILIRLLLAMIVCAFAVTEVSAQGTTQITGRVTDQTATTARNNSNFGKIQSAMDPRILQIAIKYTY